MQVLGDLIKLPFTDDIPLPWWHRSPLGLQSKTWCYIALVESNKRPAPDLLVSVLNLSTLDKIMRIRSIEKDEPGVVSKLLAEIENQNLNIALAESATIQAGELHEVTLICEPANPKLPFPQKKDLSEILEKKLEDHSILTYPKREIKWIQRGEITSGWIKNVDWREQIKATVSSDKLENIDLRKAVVSADTSHRVLRFVFPHKNSNTFTVEHLDHPGVLKIITDIFYKYQLNMLSMLLRRGGAKPGNAVLVASCESLNGDKIDSFHNAIDELEKLPTELMIKCKLSEGVPANSTIYPKEPNSVIAHPPLDLFEKVRLIKEEIPKKQLAIFFSHRFIEDKNVKVYAEHIRTALVENSCHILEASPDNDVAGPNLIFTEVSAKLWAADAAIILVSNINEEDPLGKNIPHEFGFMQGQAKPILLLIEGGLKNSQINWTNIDGIYAPRFPKDIVATSKENEGSLYSIVRKWISKVRAIKST